MHPLTKKPVAPEYGLSECPVDGEDVPIVFGACVDTGDIYSVCLLCESVWLPGQDPKEGVSGLYFPDVAPSGFRRLAGVEAAGLRAAGHEVLELGLEGYSDLVEDAFSLIRGGSSTHEDDDSLPSLQPAPTAVKRLGLAALALLGLALLILAIAKVVGIVLMLALTPGEVGAWFAVKQFAFAAFFLSLANSCRVKIRSLNAPTSPAQKRLEPWLELADGCREVHGLLYTEGDLERAGELVPDLEELIRMLPVDSPCIVYPEALALVAECQGEFLQAADHRRREIELILELHRIEAEHDEPFWALVDRGVDCLESRRAILADLLKRIDAAGDGRALAEQRDSREGMNAGPVHRRSATKRRWERIVLNSSWTPLIGFAWFQFGQTLPADHEAIGLSIINDDEDNSATDAENEAHYSYGDGDAMIRTEDGVIVAVTCFDSCRFRGSELIGLSLEEFCESVGQQPEGEPYEEVDDEDEGYDYLVYEFPRLGVHACVRDGRVEMVECGGEGWCRAGELE